MYIGPVVLEVEESRGPQLRSSASYTVRHRFDEEMQRATAPASTTDTPQPISSSHQVQSGDTLTRIVQEKLKAAGRPAGAAEVYEQVRRIAQHNGLRNPDRLHVGQTLDLAPLFQDGASRPAQGSVTSSPVAPLSSAPATSGIAPLSPVSIQPPAARAEAKVAPAPTAPLAAPAPAGEKTLVEVRPIAERSVVAPEKGRSRGKVFRHISRDTTAAQRLAALKAPETEKPFVLVARDSSPDGKGGPAPDQIGGMTLKHYREPGNLIMAVRRALHPGPVSNLASVVEAAAEVNEPRASMVEGVETKVNTTQSGPVAAALHAPARITSGFGMRSDPFNGRPAFHRGVDLAVKSGTDIYPVKEGVVKFSGWQPGYGRMVIVQHDDGLETVYAHTSSNLVQPGERVSPDSVIAKSGSSGRSTGPHLHFEVRQEGQAIDPMPHLHQH